MHNPDSPIPSPGVKGDMPRRVDAKFNANGNNGSFGTNPVKKGSGFRGNGDIGSPGGGLDGGGSGYSGIDAYQEEKKGWRKLF
jgi:hypothetical protein